METLGQQTFMGASIVNLNLQLKYDLNISTLDLNLLVDKDNKVDALGNLRVYNAVDEGYHAFNPGHIPHGLPAAALALAGGFANLYNFSGDFFYPAELGSPVWFNYYRFDKNPITEVVSTFPTTPIHPWYFNGLLTSVREDHSTQGGRLINARIEDPRRILAGMKVVLGSHDRWVAPADGSYGIITTPINRQFQDGHVGFYNVLNVFGMIEEIQGFGSSDRNKSGLVWYDPFPGDMSFKNILEILQIMLMGKPDPAKWEVHGTHTPGFPVFLEPAYWQPHPFWNGDYFTDGQERFGGPPYYVYNATNNPCGPFNPAIGDFGTAPNSAYRYKVDLSELSLLTEGQHPDGILGTAHRVNAEVISLLDLISQICKAANADFFVELLPDAAPWPPNVPGGIIPVYSHGVSGVIKIRVIHRVSPPVPGLLLRHIESSKKDPFDLPDPPFDVWRGRMSSSKIGYEFGDVVMGAILIGGPRTRVVGVTDLGKDRIRDEYVSPLNPLDILREWSQFDGVRGPDKVGPPAFVDTNKFSKDSATVAPLPVLPLGRKIADAVSGGAQDVASEQDDYRNDIWMTEDQNKPSEMQMTGPSGSTGSNVNADIPIGDDKIDLFPAFGLTTRDDYCKAITDEHPCNAVIGCSWDAAVAVGGACKQTVDLPLAGQPNIGFFNSDEPEKDFNPPNQANITERKAGLMYTVQWVVPDCDLIMVAVGVGWVRSSKPGGIYNEANCPGEDEYKGGPAVPKPQHTRPRIRRTGGVCKNAAGVKFDPPVGIDECLCGECKDSNGNVVLNHNREDCEAQNHIWTMGTWDAAAGNCSLSTRTDNEFNVGAGQAVLPQTATIEIDLSDLMRPDRKQPLYNCGDNIGNQRDKGQHIYKATVTELRAAAESRDSWVSYISNFSVNLTECMKWSGHQALKSIFETVWDLDPGAAIVEDDPVFDPGGTTAIYVSEFERILADKPRTGLPAAGGALPAGVTPTTIAAFDLNPIGRIDRTNTRAQKLRADREDFLTNTVTGAEKLVDIFYAAIRDIAQNWYGKKYMMPLPYDPEVVEQHVRKLEIKNAPAGSLVSKTSYELDWDTAGAGWVDVDFKIGGGRSGNLSYPQSFDFYDDSGKLQPFLVYPTVYKDPQGVNQNTNASKVGKSSKHETAASAIRGYNEGGGGKVFCKASIDPQTYWLWEPQAGVQFADHGGVVGDVVLGGGEEWFLEKVRTEGSINGAASFIHGDATGPVPLRLKPYALLTLDGGPVEYSSASVKGMKTSASRELLSILNFLFPGYPGVGVIAVKNDYRPGADWMKASIAAAAFKPYEAASPQRSNRESWGPWGGGISFGKVEVKKDDNLNPENAGSLTALNTMAKSQLKSTLVAQQISETGSVELTGGPVYFAGRPIVVVGVDKGPYITGITVDIGATSAVTTTYTMSNWIPELPGGAGPRAQGGVDAVDAARRLNEMGSNIRDFKYKSYEPPPQPPPPPPTF